jgi:hypothetical protein
MKKLLTLLLIFCFYTQSINSIYLQGQFFSSSVAQETDEGEEDDKPKGREKKIQKELNKELRKACSEEEGTCDYDYDGEGAAKGDGVRLAAEQIILYTMTFITLRKLVNCLTVKAMFTGPNLTFKKKYNCLGWGTIGELAGVVALLSGEIAQALMVNKAVKDEMENASNNKVKKRLRRALNDEDSKESEKHYKIKEITGNLGEFADECEDKDDLEGEQKKRCNRQIEPLQALARIIDKQIQAAKVKTILYTIAATTFTLATVTDLIAAATEKTVESVDIGATTTRCSIAAMTAASTLGVAVTVVNACNTACLGWGSACPTFFTILNSVAETPITSQETALTLAAPNSACGKADKAVTVTCAEMEKAAAEKAAEEAVKEGMKQAFTSVMNPAYSLGNLGVNGRFFALTPQNKKNDFDLLDLIFKKSYAGITFKGKDKTQLTRFYSSIVMAAGGVATYFVLSKSISIAEDSWYFSNLKRAVWHGVQAGLVWTNFTMTRFLSRRLEVEKRELENYISEVEAAISGNPTSMDVDRLVPTQEVGRDFESQFKQEFDDAFGKEKSPCPKGGDGKGGCMKMQPMMSQVIGGLGLDGLVGQTSNDVAKYADLMANKNKLNSNALKLGQKIAAAKGPLDRLKKKLMKKYNAMRAKEGKKPFEFEKLSANLLKTLKDKFYEATGQTANASVASLDKKAKKEKPLAKAKKKLAAAEKKEGKAGAEANGFTFDFQKQKEEGINDGNVVDDTDADQYTVGDADITKGTSKDIFKVITTRYFKSAYPVLVEQAK